MGVDKRVFVTGATGFIGENLCKSLSKKNIKVNALVRNPNKSPDLVSDPNVSLIRGDLLSKDDLLRASEGCSESYHIAGFVEPWHPQESYFYKINVDGTQNVLEATKENGIQKVVFTSTAGVFGPSISGRVTEKTIKQIPLTTHYERSKEEAEKVARQYSSLGMDVVIVNPTRVYGRGQISKSNAVTLLIDRYSRGKWRILPGNGNKLGNYVHIEDVVQGHLLAMEKGRSGENYLLGGESVTYRELFNIIAEESGKNHWMIPLSSRIIIFVSYLQEIQANLFNSPPLITSGFAKKYLYNWDNDSSKAERELGYRPRSLRDGIRDTLEWLSNK